MKNIQNIQNVLTRLTELLRAGGINDWAQALEEFREEIASDSEAASTKILSMFGGMGSLNDLVLYRDGQPLTKENTEFDELRSKLYELCRE